MHAVLLGASMRPMSTRRKGATYGTRQAPSADPISCQVPPRCRHRRRVAPSPFRSVHDSLAMHSASVAPARRALCLRRTTIDRVAGECNTLAYATSKGLLCGPVGKQSQGASSKSSKAPGVLRPGGRALARLAARVAGLRADRAGDRERRKRRRAGGGLEPLPTPVGAAAVQSVSPAGPSRGAVRASLLYALSVAPSARRRPPRRESRYTEPTGLAGARL
jgi:hypothetical protein